MQAITGLLGLLGLAPQAGLLSEETPLPPRRPVAASRISNPVIRGLLEESKAGTAAGIEQAKDLAYRQKIYEPKVVGRTVTNAAIDEAYKLMGDTNPVVKNLLAYTAQKESRYGDDPNTFNFRKIKGGTVGHGGIMQVTDRAVKDIVNSKSKSIQDALSNLKSNGIDFKGAVESGNIREFLEVPVNSVLAARLHYKMNNRALPELSGVPSYYTDVYAPQTKR